MTEETKPIEDTEVTTVTETPDPYKRLDEMKELLKKTEAAATRIEKANEVAAKREGIALIGGKSDVAEQTEKKEETNKEYRQRIDKELAEGKYDHR